MDDAQTDARTETARAWECSCGEIVTPGMTGHSTHENGVAEPHTALASPRATPAREAVQKLDWRGTADEKLESLEKWLTWRGLSPVDAKSAVGWVRESVERVAAIERETAPRATGSPKPMGWIYRRRFKDGSVSPWCFDALEEDEPFAASGREDGFEKHAVYDHPSPSLASASELEQAADMLIQVWSEKMAATSSVNEIAEIQVREAERYRAMADKLRALCQPSLASATAPWANAEKLAHSSSEPTGGNDGATHEGGERSNRDDAERTAMSGREGLRRSSRDERGGDGTHDGAGEERPHETHGDGSLPAEPYPGVTCSHCGKVTFPASATAGDWQSALMEAIEHGVNIAHAQYASGIPSEAITVDYAKIVARIMEKFPAVSHSVPESPSFELGATGDSISVTLKHRESRPSVPESPSPDKES